MTQVPAHRTDFPELMTVAEVASAFRVTDETIHRWCRLGRLPYINTPSGLKRFRREDIETALAETTPVGAS